MEDGRESGYIFTMYQTLDFCCMIFNLIGLGATAINYDLEFHEKDGKVNYSFTFPY
jgi:hypothetical protein